MRESHIMKTFTMVLTAASVLIPAAISQAEIKTTAEHNPNAAATPAFKFKSVPAPSRKDAGTRARFTLIAGERDNNGGDLDKLHDGALPSEEDQPGENFFFKAGTEGGRLLIDCGDSIEMKQVNTYSWHAN